MTETLMPRAGGAGADGSPLKRAQDIAVLVRSLASRTEQLGTMAPEVVAALREAGLFWLILPVECGGGGHDVLTMIETIEEISRSDGSTGWSLMANSLITGLAGSYCDETAVSEIYGGGGGHLPVLAGMLGPGGTAIEVDGGIVGGGRYSFGSGAGHADWLGAGLTMVVGGRPKPAADGNPDVRVAIVPRSAVEMLGNWDTMGLVGTGSFDYAVPERFISHGFTFARTQSEPERGGSWFRLGVPGFACAGHTAVALGITARALEEIAVVAAAKRRPAYPGPVGEHPIFQQDFSRHEATYQAMRAYSLAVFAEAQEDLAAGRDLTAELTQRFRQSTTYVHQSAADIVRFCYTWGGSDALRNPSPLGRAMRDISGATQHVYVDPLTMVDAAPSLLKRWAAEHVAAG
jgi:alkylation response protein AidB-like acyl-CoA dehydrogenase